MTEGGFAAPRMRPVGDAALTAELGEGIDPAVNARVRALDRALIERPFPGFVESVPTHRSLLVRFDPARASFAGAAAAVRARAARVPEGDEPGRRHEIPVRYGGDDGPDLEEVARHAGLSPSEVVRLHAGEEYAAFMLGFLPGFAYLGLIPPALEVPRLATPRTRVPAGSVAIAGRLTGIYPAATPGGWRLIGRASTPLFDAAREPPSLIAPGDRVRFVAVDRLEEAREGPGSAKGAGGASRPWRSAHPAFEVLEPGLLTTVQGAPRLGYRRLGVASAGALDPLALHRANRVLGNAADAPALECTVNGGALRFLRPTRFALAGADLGARLERADLGPWPVPFESAILARAGNVLRFEGRLSGCRAYVCFEGGLDVPFVLGSPSTDLLAGLGGVGGRALALGDALGLGTFRGVAARPRAQTEPPASDHSVALTSPGADEATVRVVRGPQAEHFPEEAFGSLLGTAFAVTSASDRVGLRLEGAILRHLGPNEIVSDGMVPGSIQVPPDGRPIVMLADGPTTGGYPKIGTVVTPDLACLAQLLPGSGKVRFEPA